MQYTYVITRKIYCPNMKLNKKQIIRDKLFYIFIK